MNRFGLLSRRLLERRLLGDGEGMASIIPGTLAPLSLSLLLFAIVVPERPLFDAALLLSVASFVWSACRTFLESHDLDAAALDRAILNPLPIPQATLAAARTLVVGVVLAFSTFNIALPAFVLVTFRYGLSFGLTVLAAAYLSTLAGLAMAQFCRVLLERTFGFGRVSDWEGPIRLVVGVGLFTLLFLAPDPTALLERIPLLLSVPPICFAALVDPAPLSLAGCLVTVLASLAMTLLAFRLADQDDEAQGGREQARSGTLVSRLVRRCCVLPVERAGFDFAMSNQQRDRTFRTRVYPLFAFPFAIIVLVARRPEEPTLVLLALYGAAVYLVLAEVFQAFSESVGGPELFRTLPIRRLAALRTGAEKAFLAGLVIPVYLVLALALVGLSLLGRGFGLLESLAHILLATEFALLLCALSYRWVRHPAFSVTDRGVYPGDLHTGAFMAILLGGAAAILAGLVVGNPILLASTALLLALLLKGVYMMKRRNSKEQTS
ncbi:MAG: hypothetical protein V2A76_00135 [Planctomycetota bacterium]